MFADHRDFSLIQLAEIERDQQWIVRCPTSSEVIASSSPCLTKPCAAEAQFNGSSHEDRKSSRSEPTQGLASSPEPLNVALPKSEHAELLLRRRQDWRRNHHSRNRSQSIAKVSLVAIDARITRKDLADDGAVGIDSGLEDSHVSAHRDRRQMLLRFGRKGLSRQGCRHAGQSHLLDCAKLMFDPMSVPAMGGKPSRRVLVMSQHLCECAASRSACRRS